MADEVVAKRGWLKKQSSIVRSWNLKWFVIRGAKMLYFAKDDEAKLQGTVDLHSYRIGELSGGGNSNRSDQPDRWLFELVPDCKSSSSIEALTFMAGSDQERQDWIVCIRRVLYRDLGGGVFGQKLEETMLYNATSRVPQVVEDCIEYLRTNGLECEGILRLSGRTTLIKEMRRRYDEGRRPDFSHDEVDVHTVASVLKLYFRELPEPVIPFNAFHQYLDIATSFKFQSKNKETFSNLRQLLQRLPRHNYDLLNYLVTFLSQVDEKSAKNKMPMTNLGLIFGTHILRDENSSPELEMGTQHLTTQIVLALIKWHADLFGVPDHGPEPACLPDLIRFEDVGSATTALLAAQQQPKPPSPLLETGSTVATVSTELEAHSALRSLATGAVSAADGAGSSNGQSLTGLAAQSCAQLPVTTTCLDSAQMTTSGGSGLAVDCFPSVIPASASGPCNGEASSQSSSTASSPAVAAAASFQGHAGITQCSPQEPKSPRPSGPVPDAVPKLQPPPTVPKLQPPPTAPRRLRSLPKKLDRPSAFAPPSPAADESPSAFEQRSFCSYIQSPTITPCLESMPTSVGDLRALVFSLRLLLLEKETQLHEARDTISELRTSNENAVSKVVLLQAQLVEYESRFGALQASV